MTPVHRITAAGGDTTALVRVPGSKSLANRALMCAALASGESLIHGLPSGDDTRHMVTALRDLGCVIEPERSGTRVSPMTDTSGEKSIHLGLGGTTARFLTALAATREGSTRLTAEARLGRRPFEPLFAALRRLGRELTHGEDAPFPCLISAGRMNGGSVVVDTATSSQFASALMMIGPVLRGGLSLTLAGDTVSRPYLEMTADVMARFGVEVEFAGHEITIPEGRYRGTDYGVEGDWSAAAFPIAAALLGGRTVRVSGLSESSRQADAAVMGITGSLGATVAWLPDGDLEIVPDGSVIRSADLDLVESSDLVPALATVLSCAEGTSRISGIGFVRGKESDRLSDLADELRRVGAQVNVVDDGLTIVGPARLHPARVQTHEDHRLAMALACVALRAGSVEIVDPGCVSKSWPSFWTDMSGILVVESLPS